MVVEQIHHHVAVAIGQDDLPLVAVLHPLNERNESLAANIDNHGTEQLAILANGMRHRKNVILLVRSRAVSRNQRPAILLYRLTDHAPVEIRRETMVTRHIVRGNRTPPVRRKQIDCCLPRTPGEDTIEISIEMRRIRRLPVHIRHDIIPHEKRRHQPLISKCEIVDLTGDALHLSVPGLFLCTLIGTIRSVEDNRRDDQERKDAA